LVIEIKSESYKNLRCWVGRAHLDEIGREIFMRAKQNGLFPKEPGKSRLELILDSSARIDVRLPIYMI
jgi:hypothetical protein